MWRYPLEVASSLEVLIVVPYTRSPFTKDRRSTLLVACTDRTTFLCLARINVPEPSSSVMDIDGIMKAVKKLLLTYMQEPSNKLCSSRFLQNISNIIDIVIKAL